jgi:hypothetical protein
MSFPLAVEIDTGLYRGENLGKRLIRIAPDVPA